jgi:hypothetical protein
MKTKILLFAALSLCLCAASTAQTLPAYLPADGLVGWWPFNGNANDESGNGNNGVAYGTTLIEDRFGNINSSFNLDSVGSKIILSNDYSFPGSINYTIGFWFKTQFNGAYQYVLSKRPTCMGGNEQYLEFVVLPGSNVMTYTISGGGGFFEAPFVPNDWNLVVYTRQDSIGSFYMNGELIQNYIGNYEIYPNVPLGVGSENACIYLFSQANKRYRGDIDDIFLYHRAIFPEEINALFNSEPIDCSYDTDISIPLTPLFQGDTAILNVSASNPNPTYIWQSDLGQGFTTLNNYGSFSGVGTNNLMISNLKLSHHDLPFRVISISGACTDTSEIKYLFLSDTCVNTITEVISVSTTDTLIINTLITAVEPAQENTFLVYPNPANTQITIINGNVAILGGYTMRISNSLGQVVYNQNITQPELTLDLSTWGGNGLYMLYILDPQQNILAVKQIVLQ